MESREERLERVGSLPPDVKVNMAMDMTESMVRVCAEGIRAQYPDITEKELMEKLRERLEWTKRWRKRGR
ncbi:MAG: hypothetical protein QHH18_07485 [Candidatus Bathyarchaeota archaeon]|nr:hypothetical protein [Candidatus Bathyarchaeota archaeon A05DMB-5]MDH7558424.1 hypothetical protein [Candidatus Bathyarchaeota archaeon]